MSGDQNQTDLGWRKRQFALDKMAENARELGLDYEPSKTIEMARSCGINFHQAGWPELERLVELVRADERNRTWTPSEWTEYERSIAAAEREAIDQLVNDDKELSDSDAIRISKAIRARGTTPPAAQPEQKRPQNCGTGYCSCIECVMKPSPRAWLIEFENGDEELHFDEQSVGEIHTPLYTSAIIKSYLEKDNSQRKPLTDEEIFSLADSLEIWNEDDEEWILDPNTFARAIEAAHGIKENT